MPLFSAKLDYALRAVVELALQPEGRACQSREIAAAQDIRGPYLDQILAALKRQGIVRSIRGAGGGYALARSPRKITVGDVVRALVGEHLLIGSGAAKVDPALPGSGYTIRKYEEEVENRLKAILDSTTVEDLAARKQSLDSSLSIMVGI